MKKVQVWVAPEFKTLLRMGAAEKNMGVIPYTKRIAEEANPLQKLIDEFNDKFKKKKTFDIM